MGYSMNTKDYHYIEWYKWDHLKGEKLDFVESELYDRQKDPFETVNLTANNDLRRIVKELSTELAQGWKQAMPD